VSFQSRFLRATGRDSGGIRLTTALSLSLALHVLLLWPAPLPPLARQGAQPLAATLRAAPAERAPLPAASDTPAAKTPPLVRRAATDMPTGRVAAPRELAAAAEAPGRPLSPGPVAPALGAAAGNAVAPPPAAGALDADGIRAYRILLAREARTHRRYPPLARERGWTGTAEVSVDVSPEGRARHVLLARSSGHAVLDREAVLMMSQAAAAAALPDSLRGREFAVRLPVVFDIADAQQ